MTNATTNEFTLTQRIEYCQHKMNVAALENNCNKVLEHYEERIFWENQLRLYKLSKAKRYENQNNSLPIHFTVLS